MNLSTLALQGLAQAQDVMGSLHEQGYPKLGIDRDVEEAIRWFRMAAEQGHMHAQFAMGWLAGTDEFVQWYEAAAGQGHAESAYQLSVEYAVGDVVERDAAKALHWRRIASELGYEEST
jgi:TPR repeat protein